MQLGLPIRLEARCLRRLCVIERAADRLGEGAEREACVDGARDVGRVDADVLVQPHRKLHPLADLLLDQELRIDPDDLGVAAGDFAAGVEESLPGHVTIRRVERAFDPLLAEVDDPLAEIADVDELNLALRAAWERGPRLLAQRDGASR